LDLFDLYTMSNRNGSHQSYNEFRGEVRDLNVNEFLSLGYILVIDPRDSSLDDFSLAVRLVNIHFKHQLLRVH